MKIRVSPIKPIINIFITQSIVLLVLGFSNIIDHSTMFYNTFTHSQFVSFGLMSMLVSILVLIFSITIAVLNWINNVYELEKGRLVIRQGVINTKVLEYKLDNISHIELVIPFLGKYFNYGDLTIQTKNSEQMIKVVGISDVVEIQHIIQNYKTFVSHKIPNVTDENITEILRKGESEDVEFKSSFRWDFKLKKVNRILEKVIMKTIVGFLNSNGGILFVGVSDTGDVIGLENDFVTLRKPNIDGLENHFTQIFTEYIGIEHRYLVKINHFNIADSQIVVAKVKPSKDPIYLKDGANEEFFLRTGNTTSLLNGHEILNYLKLRNKI